MGDKTDITGHSFVADQMNWEGRVHSENAAPKEWEESWGPIYDSRADSTKNPLDVGKQLKEEYYSHRIQKLEQDLKKMDKKGWGIPLQLKCETLMSRDRTSENHMEKVCFS